MMIAIKKENYVISLIYVELHIKFILVFDLGLAQKSFNQST